METLAARPYRREIVFLLQTALLLFVFTVVVGILNGTDVVDFDDDVILTHVHVGTLGFLTLSVFASALWLFGDGTPAGWQASAPRALSYAAATTVVVYDVMFLTTTSLVRPIVGSITGLVILGFFAWTAARARHVEMSVPRWGFLAAMATSVIGAVIGVLWGLVIATEDKWLPTDGEGAHPATMVVGFLVPVGMAITEWWLTPDRVTVKAPRSGFVQMALLFAGGATLTVGVLLDSQPLIMLNLPFEIAAVVIFLRRNWGALRAVRWTEPTAGRLLAFSAWAIVVNLALLAYLISKYAEDFEKTPQHLLLALDHVMFIGVMTTAVFGLLASASAARRTVLPWADQVVFWCTTVGIAGFAVGLLADTAAPKRIFTPVMGFGILVGIAAYALRLRVSEGERAPAA